MLNIIKKWFRNLFKKPKPTPLLRVHDTERSVNQEGFELIKRFEGFYPEAYRCPAGKWTIGYGTTAYQPDGRRVQRGDVIDHDQAVELLKSDINYMSNYVNSFLESRSIGMNDNEFSAIVSLCYNLGGGVLTQTDRSLHKAVISQNREAITKAMLLYVKGGGRVLPGLVKRRQAEVELFLK